MRSSYTTNRYDEALTWMIEGYKPATVVELGVLDGFSTLAIAEGIKRNTERRTGRGKLDAYDLFEDYPYKHGQLPEVKGELFTRGLADYVDLFKGDAFEVHQRYADNSIHFLHVDVSNHGDTVRKIMELWDRKMQVGGVIVFEGGTQERDQVEWMTKFGFPPIKPAIETNEILNSRYVYGTYLKFPGMTVCLKKRN